MPETTVRNLTSGTIAAKFYRTDDPWQWSTLAGGDLSVPSRGIVSFIPPREVQPTVQAVVNGKRTSASLGDPLQLNADGSLVRL